MKLSQMAEEELAMPVDGQAPVVVSQITSTCKREQVGDKWVAVGSSAVLPSAKRDRAQRIQLPAQSSSS